MKARIALCLIALALSSCNEEPVLSSYSIDPSFDCFFEEYKNQFGGEFLFPGYLGNKSGWELMVDGPWTNTAFNALYQPAQMVYDDLFVSVDFVERMARYPSGYYFDPLTRTKYEKVSGDCDEETAKALKATGPFFACGLPLFWQGHTIISTAEAFYYGLVGVDEINDMVKQMHLKAYSSLPSEGCPIAEETPRLVPAAPLDEGGSIRSKILDDAFSTIWLGERDSSEIVGVDEWFTIGHRVSRNNLWIPNFYGLYEGAYVIDIRYRTFYEEELVLVDRGKVNSSIGDGRPWSSPLSYASSYYGDDNVTLEHPVHTVRLGIKELSFPFASQIPVVYKNGEFYSLEEAFASGFLDSNAVNSIAAIVERFYQTQIKPDQDLLELPA